MKHLTARWFAPLYNPYRHFFSLPDVKRTLVIAFVARMPVGMTGLALIMFLREAYSSFKIAGTVMGIYFLAMAVTAPFVGRIIDRHGRIVKKIQVPTTDPVTGERLETVEDVMIRLVQGHFTRDLVTR